MDVALAAFKCIYLDPARPQYHTVASCQFNANELSVVEQHGHLEAARRVWVAKPKTDVLYEILDDVADVLYGMVDMRACKIPKGSIQALVFFADHVVRMRPAAMKCRPNYEHKWRADHPDKSPAPRIVMCDMICAILQDHAR